MNNSGKMTERDTGYKNLQGIGIVWNLLEKNLEFEPWIFQLPSEEWPSKLQQWIFFHIQHIFFPPKISCWKWMVYSVLGNVMVSTT